MPNWFMVGSMVALICLMFGSVLVPAWFIQLWLSYGSGLVQCCVHMLHICGSDGVLGLLLTQVVKLWVLIETDMVRFGFRCVSILVSWGSDLVHDRCMCAPDTFQMLLRLGFDWVHFRYNLKKDLVHFGFR